MNCPKCGTEIRINARFCTKCGARMILQSPSNMEFSAQTSAMDDVFSFDNDVKTSVTSEPIFTDECNDTLASEPEKKSAPTSNNAKKEDYADTLDGRSKYFAGFIGVFLGFSGFHWFYLRQKSRGIVYLCIALLLVVLSNDVLLENYIRFCILESLMIFFCSHRYYEKYVHNSLKRVGFYLLVSFAILSPFIFSRIT